MGSEMGRGMTGEKGWVEGWEGNGGGGTRGEKG